MKGIVLAGGSGTRMYPLTLATSKQLLAIYDKPMVYYPLSVLMLAGMRDILVISTPSSLPALHNLLGDGSHLGLDISYAEQAEPRGIAEAFIIGADYIGNDQTALILGDNVFHGAGFPRILRACRTRLNGCTMFGYPVSDPERYGIGEVDGSGALVSIEEKPLRPRSNDAITGLYFYDNDVVEIARDLVPSPRGELEITDVNQTYLKQGRAHLVRLGRGFTWLDAGTHDSILAASQYVQVIEKRQGVRVACLEEIAVRMGYIDADACHRLGAEMKNSEYGQYLMEIAQSLG
ncbi:glucose-1-phosphate thymidylyltransferase RfbA [Streptosporangium sp. NBC_01755]|uniref:glucose-1-phosphate thymidylyltransferase RfbA n=1 Tax=unclassified Streptosporangium TaxID=2632669 RepID=UPI002DD94704|nr:MULTISPECIES: glucose-1-phosphate thymidylyltransferase RfbA [unclassified Streptosporangium]WSA25550.1 glucose-1-phosphate thymidylyltransferase RfbA [Streptosporangium sp. NBC_01810]WSD03062.1 glucose-1-phosphate thymidylyltransferase RfbA [Streptosporangium sp. NBC_01755]